jgi:hypothetical protein
VDPQLNSKERICPLPQKRRMEMEIREKFGKLVGLKDVENGRHRSTFNNLDICCSIQQNKITGSVYPARYFKENHFEIRNINDFEKFEWNFLNAKLLHLQEEKERTTTQMCLDNNIWEMRKNNHVTMAHQTIPTIIYQHYAKNVEEFPETLPELLRIADKHKCSFNIRYTPNLMKKIWFKAKKTKKDPVEILGAALAFDNITSMWYILFIESEMHIRRCVKPSDIKRIHQISRNTAACHSLKKLLMD